MLIKYVCICELKQIIDDNENNNNNNNNIDTISTKKENKSTSTQKTDSSDAANEHEWDIIDADFEEYDDLEDYQIIHNNIVSSTVDENDNNNNNNNKNNENNEDIRSKDNTLSTVSSHSVDNVSIRNNEDEKVGNVTKYQAVLSNKYPDIEDDQFELLPGFVFPTNSVLDLLEFHWFVLTDVRLSFIDDMFLSNINLINY
jgi:hypothetical protein